MAIEQSNPFSNSTSGGYYTRDTGESVVTSETNALVSDRIFSNLDIIENKKPIMGMTVVDNFGNTQASGSATVTSYVDLHPTATSATATVTITDFTELNTGDKVNLIATDTTNYDFVNGDQSSVAGTWESTTSNTQTAINLMNVINTSSGPSGTRFTATSDGAVVTITQATIGTAGNTTVTLTDSGTVGMSKTNFTGGIDGGVHTFVLTASDGTAYTVTASSSTTTTIETPTPTYQVVTSNNVTAANMNTCVNALDRFSSSVVTATATFKQLKGGLEGNTTITVTDPSTAGMSKVDFTGGTGPDIKLQGSHNGTDWVDIVTLDEGFPGTTGVYAYYPNLLNTYVPIWRIICNDKGIDMGKAGTAKFFYMYK